MNAEQLLKQVFINRELILRKSNEAHEHLEMLERDYAHLIAGEVAITLEMNKALAALYFDSDYAKAMEVSINAIEKFRDTPWRTPMAFHMKMVSHCHLHLGEYDLAIRYLQEGIATLSVDDAHYLFNKADMLYTMAEVEEQRDPKNPGMAEYLQEALDMLKDDAGSVRSANCLMGLGNYYNNIEKPEIALKYFCEAVTTYEQKYLLQHMANCYSNMGICYLQLEEYLQAERYMQKALELRMKSGSPDQLAISYSNFGRLYKLMEDYDKAEECLARSQKIAEEIGFKQVIDRNNDMLYEVAGIKGELKRVGKAA